MRIGSWASGFVAVLSLVAGSAEIAMAAVPQLAIVSRADGAGGRLANVGPTWPIDVSDDGRFVLFQSADAGLGDAPGLANDYAVYLRDMEQHHTELLNRETGADGAAIAGCLTHGMSADGRLVTMHCHDLTGASPARMLVRDRVLHTTTEINALQYQTYISTPTADGHYAIVGGGDATGTAAARVDLLTQTPDFSTRYSGSDGARTNNVASYGFLSANGRYATFTSGVQDLETPHSTEPEHPATGPEKAYVRDFDTDTTTLVSRAEGVSGVPADKIAVADVPGNNGRVLFSTDAQSLGLLPPGSLFHHFIRDVPGAHTVVADRNSAGALANSPPSSSALSPDGRYYVWNTHATNLDGCVSGSYFSLYVRDLDTGITRLISRNGNTQNNATVRAPAYSRTGRYLAFSSAATNLDPPMPNVAEEVYLAAEVPSVFALPERAPCEQGGGPGPVGGGGNPAPGPIASTAPATSPSTQPTAARGRALLRTRSSLRLSRRLPIRLECVGAPCRARLSSTLRTSRTRTFRLHARQAVIPAGARRTMIVRLSPRAVRAARSSLRRGQTVGLAVAVSSDRGDGRRAIDRRSVRLRLR